MRPAMTSEEDDLAELTTAQFLGNPPPRTGRWVSQPIDFQRNRRRVLFGAFSKVCPSSPLRRYCLHQDYLYYPPNRHYRIVLLSILVTTNGSSSQLVIMSGGGVPGSADVGERVVQGMEQFHLLAEREDAQLAGLEQAQGLADQGHRLEGQFARTVVGHTADGTQGSAV